MLIPAWFILSTQISLHWQVCQVQEYKEWLDVWFLLTQCNQMDQQVSRQQPGARERLANTPAVIRMITAYRLHSSIHFNVRIWFLIGFFKEPMANHEIWYFCHDQPLKFCHPGDRGVTQILPNSVTVSLPTSGMQNPAYDCKSCEILWAFWGASASGKMWHHLIAH